MRILNLQLFAQENPAEAPADETSKEMTTEERLAKLEAMLESMNKPAQPTYAEELKAKEEELRQANAKAILAKLRQQEAEARELYPKLSLKEELKDPRFADLLKC